MQNEEEKKEFVEFLKVSHKPKRFYTQRAFCQCFKCGACNKRFFECRKLIHYKEIDENRNLTENEIYKIFKVCNYGGDTTNYYREHNRQGYRMHGTNEQTPQEMDKEEQTKK